MTDNKHPAPVGTLPRARWSRIGFILFLIYAVAFAERTNISVAAPAMQDDLALSTASTGLMLSAFFWGYILTQVPGGWLANRYGSRVVISVALVMWGVTALLTAAAPTLPLLLAARFLMGLSEGVVWPAFAVLFMNWFPRSERARAAGLALLALPVSAVIMSPAAGWLIDHLGWKEMFVVQGIPAFLLALVAWVLLSNDPTQDRRLSATERDYILATREQRDPGVRDATFTDVLRSPAVWVCTLVYFLWLIGFYSFALWLPTVLKDLSLLDIEAVGWLSVIPFGIAGCAMVLNARASDRSTRSRSWFIIPPLVLASVVLIVQHFLPQTLALQMIMLVVVAIGIYAPFGPWWAWAFEHVPTGQTGPASGLINVGGSLGGVVGPLVVAWAAGGGLAANGFWALGVSLALASALAAALGAVGRRTHSDGPLAQAALPQTLERSETER